MSRIRHIVLFRIHDEARGGSQLSAMDLLNRLRELPGILEWAVEASLDSRKGAVVVLNVLFESEQAFADYRLNPKHVEVAQGLSMMADWLVADYVEAP